MCNIWFAVILAALIGAAGGGAAAILAGLVRSGAGGMRISLCPGGMMLTRYLIGACAILVSALVNVPGIGRRSAWRHRNYRFWHKAEMPVAATNVRFWV